MNFIDPSFTDRQRQLIREHQSREVERKAKAGVAKLTFGDLRVRYRRLMAGYTSPYVSIRKTIARILWKHDVTWRDVKGPRRDSKSVACRQECMWTVAGIYRDWSYPRIGKLLGKDHSTVIHAVARLNKWAAEGRIDPIRGMVVAQAREIKPRKPEVADRIARRDAMVEQLRHKGLPYSEIAVIMKLSVSHARTIVSERTRARMAAGAK